MTVLTSQSGASLVPEPRFHRTLSFFAGLRRDPGVGESRLGGSEHDRLVLSTAQRRRRRPQNLLCTFWRRRTKKALKKTHEPKRERRNVFFFFHLWFQFAEGILPHRSALGFPGLAGGFTFTIYGQSCGKIVSAPYFYQNLWVHSWNKRRGGDPGLNVKTVSVSHSGRLWDQLLTFAALGPFAYVPIGNNIFLPLAPPNPPPPPLASCVTLLITLPAWAPCIGLRLRMDVWPFQEGKQN